MITQANASFVSDETVSVFAFDKFTMASPRMPALFTQQGSNKASENQGSMSGLGTFQLKTEGVGPELDQPVQQFKKEFLHQEFALGTVVERKVYDDQNFPFLQKLGGHIGTSALRTFEQLAAGVFIGAFSSGDYTTEDGAALCAAHTNKDGGNSQTNAGTSSFSYDSLGATMILHRNFTDYRGEDINIEPDLILHPSDIDQTVFEAIRSYGDPTEANLKANYYNGKLSSLSWQYLTNAADWFLIDSMMMKDNLFWYWKAVLEIFGVGDAWAGLRKIGGYFRSSHSAVDWRWAYGHNVP